MRQPGVLLSWASSALALSSALVLTACQSLEDGAKAEFSSQFTCPLERIEARARPDLKPSQVEREPSRPSPEIAADPERLKIFQQKQAELDANVDRADSVVEARGCGHTVLYTCGHPTRSSSGKRWMCSHHAYPPGVATW
jgi:hypothetical protein